MPFFSPVTWTFSFLGKDEYPASHRLLPSKSRRQGQLFLPIEAPRRLVEASIPSEGLFMNRVLLIGIFSTVAAWLLIRSAPARRTVPARVAAAKLQQAWADHHTTA